MWFLVCVGVAAGLVQAAGVSWWGTHPVVVWPVLVLAMALPAQRGRWVAAAIAAGLAWDSVSGTLGSATLALLAAGALALAAEQRWLPARGGVAGGALAGAMVLVVHCVLFVVAGFASTGVSASWWLVEAAGTGVLAAAAYRLAAPLYGRRSF